LATAPLSFVLRGKLRQSDSSGQEEWRREKVRCAMGAHTSLPRWEDWDVCLSWFLRRQTLPTRTMRQSTQRAEENGANDSMPITVAFVVSLHTAPRGPTRNPNQLPSRLWARGIFV